MGTVHAKAQQDMGKMGGGGGSGLFEFEEPIELDDTPMPKTNIKLGGVRARVDRVHVDGLSRTKDDLVRTMVDDLFRATDFEDVIQRAHKVRSALDGMGCFRDIGVFIDVSSGPGSTPEGLEVTFQVKELSRVVGGVNTTVSENEGNLVVGVKMPNALGRGERVQAEYSVGHRSTSNYSLTAVKPLPTRPLQPHVSATVYQQSHEYPCSGYRLLDRGLLLDLAFNTAPHTKHNLQWEGLVRDTSVLSKTTSFQVRESSGPQMKSVVRHIVSVDRRDDGAFPSRGSLARLALQAAGLGGGVAHLRAEANVQWNRTIAERVVVQVSAGAGVLHDVFGTALPDRLYVGGNDLRAFATRGVGPHSHGHAVGGNMYWLAGLHMYAPLPFSPAQGGIGELFRSHFFIDTGCLHYHDGSDPAWRGLAEWRMGAGAGVALRLGRGARLELNYCVPLRAAPGDRTAPGLQFGVAAHTQ